MVGRDQLRRILKVMLDENEFLSPYGIRAISRYHKDNPYTFSMNGDIHRVDYEPGESSTGLFGGYSNWRGPIWFPMNYLLVESLQKFHHDLGDDFKVECPTGSGQMMTLWEVAAEISRRLTHVFLQGVDRRAARGWLRPSLSRRPALEGSGALLRVSPRRQRFGRRCKPPDRLDGRRGEAPAAERRISPEAASVATTTMAVKTQNHLGQLGHRQGYRAQAR
jgi:hypothetical protein